MATKASARLNGLLWLKKTISGEISCEETVLTWLMEQAQFETEMFIGSLQILAWNTVETLPLSSRLRKGVKLPTRYVETIRPGLIYN